MITLEVATEPMDELSLSQAEAATLSEFQTEGRRREWLTGRAALKAVLRQQGRSQDTSVIRWPDRAVSLSHSKGMAVAAGLKPEARKVIGVGVDIEQDRPVTPRVARFFLSEEETPSEATELLRLWSVKEAVFKADPENALRSFRDYRLLSPGRAVCRRSGKNFVYYSHRMDGGWLTLALCEAKTPSLSLRAKRLVPAERSGDGSNLLSSNDGK